MRSSSTEQALCSTGYRSVLGLGTKQFNLEFLCACTFEVLVNTRIRGTMGKDYHGFYIIMVLSGKHMQIANKDIKKNSEKKNCGQLFKYFVFQTFPVKFIRQNTWASFVSFKGENYGSPFLRFLIEFCLIASCYYCSIKCYSDWNNAYKVHTFHSSIKW